MIDSPQPERHERIKAIHKQIFTLVWFAFKRFVHRLQNYSLTQAQFITLVSLATHGKPATMRQLTQVTFQDPPTMTGIVNRLVKMGLVRRARSEDDRRHVWVEATPKAIALVQQIEQDMQAEDPYEFNAMTDDEIATMEGILEYILARYIQQINREDFSTAEKAKEHLNSFASDPIEFIKTQME